MKKIFICFLLLYSIKSFSQLPPSVPSGFTAAQVGLTRTIKMDWTPSTGAPLGYKVYKEQPGVGVDSARTGLVNTYSFNNVLPGFLYKVYLRSFRLKTTAPFDTIYSANSAKIDVFVGELSTPGLAIDNQFIKSNQIGLTITSTNYFHDSFEISYSANGTELFKIIPANSTYYDLTGLSPNTFYGVKIRARSGANFTPWSTTRFATTLIDFPAQPTLSIGGNCPNSVNLNWTISQRASEISYFIIQRSFDNVNFSNIANNVTPDSRNYTDNNASPGSNTFYRIYSVNTTGSTPSNNANLNVKTFVASNPATNLISDPINKSRNFLNFSWTNGTEDSECNTNKRGEIVFSYKVNGEAEYRDIRLPPNATSLKIDNLKPLDVVTVRILVVSDRGFVSSQLLGSDITAGPPKPPSNLIIIRSTDALGVPFFELQWKDNSVDEDYFIIERSIDDINFEQVGKIIFNTTQFKDSKLDEGPTYYYRIKSGSNTEGDSPYTNSVFGIIKFTIIPNAPIGLVAKLNAGKIELKWRDDSSNEENFIVEKSSDGGNTATAIATLGRNVTAFVDENVLPGKLYYYRVKAKNIIGDSQYSNIEIITVPAVGFILNSSLIKVYPNPTFEIVKIKTPLEISGKTGNVKIYNKNNVLIYSKVHVFTTEAELEINVSNFEEGMYSLQITEGLNKVSKKVYKF